MHQRCTWDEEKDFIILLCNTIVRFKTYSKLWRSITHKTSVCNWWYLANSSVMLVLIFVYLLLYNWKILFRSHISELKFLKFLGTTFKMHRLGSQSTFTYTFLVPSLGEKLKQCHIKSPSAQFRMGRLGSQFYLNHSFRVFPKHD